MLILILLIDKNSPIEVEVEPPVEGKPSTPNHSVSKMAQFCLHFICCFHDNRVHDILHDNGCFLCERNPAPPLFLVEMVDQAAWESLVFIILSNTSMFNIYGLLLWTNVCCCCGKYSPCLKFD